MAGMLSKLWDDVAGGSPPDKGMKQLRKSSSPFLDGMVSSVYIFPNAWQVPVLEVL